MTYSNAFLQFAHSQQDTATAYEVWKHCKRTAYYAYYLTERLGLKDSERCGARIGALLHDIGKIRIATSIIEKASPLNGTEWSTLKHHPELGTDLIQKLYNFLPILQAVKHHHEHFDGSGYPDHLEGEAIPIEARIVSVVDTWDVMRSKRSYKSIKCQKESMQEMIDSSWTQLDGRIVRVFLRLIDEHCMKEGQ